MFKIDSKFLMAMGLGIASSFIANFLYDNWKKNQNV